MSVKSIPASCKRILNNEQVIFFSEKSGWFSIRKLIHVSHHVEIIQRRKTYMIISTYSDKTFGRWILIYGKMFQFTRQALSPLNRDIQKSL